MFAIGGALPGQSQEPGTQVFLMVGMDEVLESSPDGSQGAH